MTKCYLEVSNNWFICIAIVLYSISSILGIKLFTVLFKSTYVQVKYLE
jgi:hypothetical protein